jgi:hypothetical protein
MATYQITSAQNATELAGKTGADTYLVNGGTLVLDCDTRVGPNQGQVLGNITVSTTLGGRVRVDGSRVRLIPFSGGSGPVPATGTAINQGAASVEVLCVMSSRTGGTIYTGQMPATGWLKVRGTGIVAGAFTSGVTATATGPDETGWMVIAGAETRSITVPRLGDLEVDGRWLDVGVTTGVRGQTLQLPHFTAENATYYPGVEIETTPGVFEFWANAGKQFNALGIDSRSRFCHISATGLVTLGGLTYGFMPGAGCKVRVPNIILQTSASNKAHNAEPQELMGSRYESVFGAGGTLAHSISTGAWYWNITQAHALTATDLHTCDQVTISRIATKPVIDNLHVGMSTRTGVVLNLIPLNMQNCTAGGTVGTISAVRGNCTTTSGYCAMLSALSGSWSFGKITSMLAANAAAVAGSLFVSGCYDIHIENLHTTGKRALLSGGARITIDRHVYADNVTGSTSTTEGSHILEVLSTEAATLKSATNWVPESHPRNGIVYAANTKGLRVRGIGTAQQPFSGGTINPTAQLWSDGGNNADFRIERNWVTDTRNGVASPNSSSAGGVVQNNYIGNAAPTAPTMQSNTTFRGNRHNGGSVPTLYSGTYGTAMWDAFTGDTTTRLALVFSEPLASSGAVEILAGSPKFTGQGGIVMQMGDSAVWTVPHSILGWAGLVGMGSSGVNTAFHAFEYSLDRGDGWSAYKALIASNLAAEPILSPSGFRIRIKVTCTATNYANHLTGLWVNGTTSLALQNAALYPAEVQNTTLTIAGLEFNSRCVVRSGGDELFAATSVGDTMHATFVHDAARTMLDVTITKTGKVPLAFGLPNSMSTGIVVAQTDLDVSGDGAGGVGGVEGTPAGDIAAAVQALLLDDFAAIDARISNTMHDAYNPNQEWFVLTKDGQHLVGVTTQNPYLMGLQEGMSIAEFTGQIPDLNFSAWDFGNDVFKSTLTPRLNFMSRFSVSELAAIRGSTDATVRDIMERFDVQKYINSTDQLTIDSVQWFATQGLIAPERVVEILA